MKDHTFTPGSGRPTNRDSPGYWSAYNVAASRWKEFFGWALGNLVSVVEEGEHGVGRHPYSLRKMIFLCAGKVFSKEPSRQFTSWSRDAVYRGWVAPVAEQGELASWLPDGLVSVPHFNTISNYLRAPRLTPILKELVTISAVPLSQYETEWAIDASGFTISRLNHWDGVKHGSTGITCRQSHGWIKGHFMSGVRTNIVVSADVSEAHSADTKHLAELLGQTRGIFTLGEIMADKAYLSKDNFDLIEAYGALPFIPFKVNTRPVTLDRTIWARMYHLFIAHHPIWSAEYHKRSNVESTIWMIKAHFGEHVRSASYWGQVNEVLCKVLCHNIWC